MFGMLLLALGLTWQGNNPPPMPAEIVGANYSYVDGQRYTFYVSRIDVEQSPRWLESMDNPPLSARAAIQSARALMPHIVTGGDRWRLGTVSLGQILLPDAWIYNIAFTEPPPSGVGGFAGGAQMMTVVVLMDGRAVVPFTTPLGRGR